MKTIVMEDRTGVAEASDYYINKKEKRLADAVVSGHYERFLEQSPSLLEKYKELKHDPDLCSLTQELAIMKLLLGQVISAMAQAHAKNHVLPPSSASIVFQFISEIANVAAKATDIEQKRAGKMGPAQLTAFLVGLKTGLTQDLREHGLLDAIPVVTDRLATVPWAGDGVVRDRVAGAAIGQVPADFEVKFRVIKNEGEDGPAVTESELVSADDAGAINQQILDEKETLIKDLNDQLADAREQLRETGYAAAETSTKASSTQSQNKRALFEFEDPDIGIALDY